MVTWREAKTAFKVGDRVRLTDEVGDYPIYPKPAGSLGTVAENNVDDPGMGNAIMVKLDVRHSDLVEWDNCVAVYSPEFWAGSPEEAEKHMDEVVPLEVIP